MLALTAPMQGSENNSMKTCLEKFHILMPVILAGMLLYSCHRENSLSPEDGLKAIKVLNSDLINLSNGIKENSAFTGLSYLLEEPTSPLSTKNGLIGLWLNDTLSSLRPFNGKYSWSEQGFVKNTGSTNIDIDFQYPDSSGKGNFSLSGFECRMIASALCFPTEIAAKMQKDGKEILAINGNSVFMEDLPAHAEFDIKGDDFDGSVKMDRTRKENTGTLDIAVKFSAQGHEIISGSVHAVIGYSGSQIYYRTYEPDISIFEVIISGKLDYGKVDPTSKEYVKSFNDQCRIGFFDSGSRKKIGDFGIAELKESELLGWAIFLSDGSQVILEDYLLILEKLFNHKLPNKV
jgi:hypothetical protein